VTENDFFDMIARQLYIMKFTIILGIAIILVGCGSYYFFTKDPVVRGEKINEVSNELSITPSAEMKPQFTTETHIIAEGDTFGIATDALGISYGTMLGILDAASSTYDFTRVRVGQPLTLAKNLDGSFAYLDYEQNRDTIVRFFFADNRTEIIPIEYETETVNAVGVVSSSMYLDALTLGVPDAVIMQFADTFAWTIDFSTQVQQGDSFSIVYDKRRRNGEDAGTGSMHAGKFVNNGKELYAFLYEQEPGKPSYFNENGESMVKAFLRAPLEYKRITSGYTTARFHPILGRNTTHLAIDYAAPIGTPIMAVGDGTISFAGWNSGGFGNFVTIKHNDKFITEYAHLSSFAKGIKAGVRVTQGQVIGYVGSTGLSTGPHLHYQIRQNGALVNPLTVEFPPGEPIEENHREAFNTVVSKYKDRL